MGLVRGATCGICLATAIPAGQALGRPFPEWPVEHWVSLAPARHAGRAALIMSPSLVDSFEQAPEEIIVIGRRHIQDLAPRVGVDASELWSLYAAQPVVRNLQTDCDDKGPSSTICYDMTQVPLRTRPLRLSSLLFGN